MKKYEFITKLILIPILLILSSGQLWAQVVPKSEIDYIKQQWAKVKYLTPSEQKVSEFEKLIKKVETVAERYPGDVNVALWHGTVLSTYASLKGGVGALASVKKAKQQLEYVLEKNPNVESGYAHVILGALYSNVPSWPVAFGNKEKAKSHLNMALHMDPDSVDGHFYYGDLMVKQGKYAEAKRHFQRALAIPKNKTFVVADNGRRDEIVKSMQVVEKKIG